MKIYAVSDLHGNLTGLTPNGCDIVVIAGDFAPLNGFTRTDILHQREWICDEFTVWMRQYRDIEFIIIPGNHDICLDPVKIRAYGNVSDFKIDWPANSHMLINQLASVRGINFYGTPNVPIISHRWAFESEHDTLVREFSKIPKNVDVLVTHSPPHLSACCIDRSMQWGGDEAFGSSELTEAIIRVCPKYAFCGHIHTGEHGGNAVGNTMVYNVSRVDENYNIAFDPTVIEINV